jgi:putative PIN family toxin of toxin-antitoxin system
VGAEIVSRPRAVLDTNVLLSALLFEGEVSRLVALWQKGDFLFLLTRPILDEYLRALAYPKFQLTDREVKALIEEDLLPFVEVVQESKRTVPRLKDRDDEKFLAACLGGKADVLVTGDKELLAVKSIGKTAIESPGDFLKRITVTPR